MIKELRGALGDVVYRTSPNGKVYISKRPDMSKVKWSKGTSKPSGQMSETSATRAINKRVELLGCHADIEGLSPHDCRHYAATFEARKIPPVDRLVDMFGWNSPAMAFRYIEAAQIADEGTARVKQP